MKRPFKELRPIGPFSQVTEEIRNTYLVMYKIETDEVIDGSDIQRLEQSLKSEQVENGGDLFAIVEDVSIRTFGFTALEDPGEERRFLVKTKITPDVQGSEDRFVLTKSMIDIIKRKIQNEFGKGNIESSWEIDVAR